MTARNPLLTDPPHAVEQALKRLGTDIRTARLRRNLTLQDVAATIGAGVRAVGDAERGKPSTSAAVYTAMLWALDLLPQFDEVARPERDDAGQMLALGRERARARQKAGL
jgi:transcriptional regulator with XRE-family HTH domain